MERLVQRRPRRRSPIKSPLDDPQFREERPEPFWLTNVKVGAVLFTLCAATYSAHSFKVQIGTNRSRAEAASRVDSFRDGDVPAGLKKRAKTKTRDKTTRDQTKKTNKLLDRLPSVPSTLPSNADGDAFSVAWALRADLNAAATPKWFRDFDVLASDLRDSFASRYGSGDEARARSVLSRGVDDLTPAASPPSLSEAEGGFAVPRGVRHTANRILHARYADRPLVVSIGGSSTPTGRGNAYQQSYPAVLEKLLTPALNGIGVRLEVRNAGVANSTPLPYGWCLPNVAGDDADVLGWDFSGSGGGGDVDGGDGDDGGADVAFEAALRRAVLMPRSPKIVVLGRPRAEGERSRDEAVLGSRVTAILQRYLEEGTVVDPILLRPDRASDPYLRVREPLRPAGFQNWTLYGGPPDGPDQHLYHPAVREHELVGYLLAVHLLAATEVAAGDILRSHEGLRGNGVVSGGGDGKGGAEKKATTAKRVEPAWGDRKRPALLPHPLGVVGDGEGVGASVIGGGGDGDLLPSLLYGVPMGIGDAKEKEVSVIKTNDKEASGTPSAQKVTETEEEEDRSSSSSASRNPSPSTPWTMNPVQCRTSFDPTLGGTLRDAAVSGTVGEDVDLDFPRGPLLYNRGWVVAVGPDERVARGHSTRQEARGVGGGFRDSTKAYYGVPASGTLSFFLPYNGTLDPEGNGENDDSDGRRRILRSRRGESAAAGTKQRKDKEEERTKADEVDSDENAVEAKTPPSSSIAKKRAQTDVSTEDATGWFRSVVVCESTGRPVEKEACKFGRDVSFVVGGVEVVDVELIDAAGASFGGKPLCVIMNVPQGARLTTREQMSREAKTKKKDRDKDNRRRGTRRLVTKSGEMEEGLSLTDLGISLELAVSNPKVSWKKGACSVSHVVWETAPRPQK